MAFRNSRFTETIDQQIGCRQRTPGMFTECQHVTHVDVIVLLWFIM